MIPGRKINIIALNSDHKDTILKWVNNPVLKDLTGTVYPVSDIEHSKWFDSKRLSNEEHIYGISTLSGELVGIIGLKDLDMISRNAEMYIYIGDKENQSLGYGKDAVTTLIAFAFNNLNLHKISLKVFEYNNKAANMYQGVGFNQEGILKDSLYRNGKYHDVVIMGLINDGEY